MSPLGMAYVVVAAVCVVVGLEHLGVGLRLEHRRVHVLFAAAALAAAVDALVQRRFAFATSTEEFESLFEWSAVSICTVLILLLWFIEARTGAVRRSLLVVETGLLIATAGLDFVLPDGIFATIDVIEVRQAVLPWGEVFTRPVGVASPWRVVGDAANIGFLVLLIDTTFRLTRSGRRREAWVIGVSTLALSLSVLAIIPMDLGYLDLPSLHPFAFLLIVAVMAWDLSDSAARAAELSREVVANERRWRQLLDHVQLLAVRIDTEGRVTEVNPYFRSVLGYRDEDVERRHFWKLVAEEQRDERRRAFVEAIAGNPTPEVEVEVTAADGSRRRIVWRNVILRDSGGAVEGMLSIGADVTEQRGAEAQRDLVRRQLEATVRELEVVRAKLEEENIVLKEEIGSPVHDGDIVGVSDALAYVLHKIQQVAGTEATVLIQGETGVGKELVATAIHKQSARSDGPFLAVNCAALPASLIESELFGHERGAFTGADRRRIGRFELATGGTLFLDEVAELPQEVQPKLLRAVQESQVERIGGDRPIEVDVRIIAATNRDLRAEVEAGRFRGDLYYRLEVYPITVPPLRDRPEDIEPLVHHFARRFSERHRIPIEQVPPEVLRQLEAYPWPGNVRELQNIVERAVLAGSDGVLRLATPLGNGNGRQITPAELDQAAQRPPQTLAELERTHILDALGACGGRIGGAGGAAERLGLHPNTLRSRMKKHGITQKRR